MELTSIRPLAAILVSAVASLLILASDKRPNLRESWTLIAALLKFGIVCSLLPAVQSGSVFIFRFFEILPGAPVFLKVDPLGIYFALLSSGLWIITSIYSIGYMRSLKEHEQTRYYFSFALSLSAAIGIAFAGDLFSFFVFFEMLTVATYPLVAHKQTKEAILGARKYLVYSLSAAALLLFAILWTYQTTGSLSFRPGGFLGSGLFNSQSLIILFFLFLYGVSVKAALFPMHAWLPTAMVAPTPVSALLHAVAVVKAGVFGVLRVIGFVFGPELLRETGLWIWPATLAGFTILMASMIALASDNLKRRLAYSTISQLSYIILGASIISPDAYTGAMLHLSNHALMKITLFFCAGVIYVKTHKENISDMKGIGFQLPGTLIAFAVGAIGLSGFPVFSGFISKWFLCKGAFEAGLTAVVFVYLVGALLNAGYLVPVLITAFSKPSGKAVPDERPRALTWPPFLTAVLTVCFGTIPFLIINQLNLIKQTVAAIFLK